MSDETTATVPESTEPKPEAAEEKKPEKLNQIVEIKDVGPCRKHIKVAVDRADIDKAFNEKYKELVGESFVPGFRPGKAPRQVVIRKYKKEVGDQVKAIVLMSSLEQLAEDHDIAPLTPPDLNPNNLMMPDNGPFVYEFEVEVRPQFDLPDYKGLKLKRPVYPITDEDVVKEESRLLSRHGQLIPKPEGNVQVGDFITIDMTSEFQGKSVGQAKELLLRVDDTVTFKDGVASTFGATVRGANAGDRRVVDIAMTDAVAVEQLRGQTVKATVEIKDVKKLRMPELTHEFLHEAYGVHNPEQLREQIRIALEKRLQYRQRQSAREQILSHIAASSTWALPRNLLLNQAKKTLARRTMEMKEAGMSEEEIKARGRMLERDVIASTEAALKEHFVLQKIAEVEKIEVEDDDIDQEIERLADLNNDTPRRVRAQLEKEDLVDTLAAQLIERKALDLILDSAEYEEVSEAKESGLAAVEQQAVPGELKDPTAAPQKEEEKKDETPTAEQASNP